MSLLKIQPIDRPIMQKKPISVMSSPHVQDSSTYSHRCLIKNFVQAAHSLNIALPIQLCLYCASISCMLDGLCLYNFSYRQSRYLIGPS
jgi:hypothetical protein